ncbi:MAG: hypothetical protein IBX50_20110, partial [Marinospirillum sp.]|nr:hypothetical protein [Marinospirillum sp.]
KHSELLRWLVALGMPPSGSEPLFSDDEKAHWQTLVQRSPADWQQRRGIGASRAAALQHFFHHPQIQQQALRLQHQGVEGFADAGAILHH